MALNADAVLATNDLEFWYKAFATSNAMPADTIAFGSSVTGFTEAGYTSGGITLGLDTTRSEIRMDQSRFALRNPITEANFTLGTELGEINPANYLFATGLGAVSTLAPSSGVRGHDDWALTDDFTDALYTVLANIKQADNEAFRIVGWKMVATGALDSTFSPDDAATIAVEFTGQPDTSTDPARIATIRDVTPAA